MEEENKIINFEDVKEEVPAEEVETTVEEVTEEPAEETVVEESEESISKEQVEEMLKTAEMMVNVMKEQWLTTSKEYQIDDAIMQAIGKWNDEHRTPMPSDLSDEEKDEWDHLNGIDCITQEAVEEIFGAPPHPIYGPTLVDTINNIKTIGESFLGWTTTLREYRNIHDAYLQLIELEEEESLNELKEKAEQETDPIQREQFLNAIDTYYDRKYLGFLTKPLSDEVRDSILFALKDVKKIEYWIKRARDKLSALKISPTIILELSQFERRCMEPKYANNNMLLLLYFVRLAAYCDPNHREDEDRTKVVCMVMAMDALIRKIWSPERADRLMKNIKAYEDQFLPCVPEVKTDESITPPVEDPISGEPKSDENTPYLIGVDLAGGREGDNTQTDMDEKFQDEEAMDNVEENYMLEGISDDFETDELGQDVSEPPEG